MYQKAQVLFRRGGMADPEMGTVNMEWRLWLLQSRQQTESDAAELRRQIDGLKDQLDGERKKQSTFERRISELNEKLRNAENTVSTTSHQLVQESSSLELLNKTKVGTVNHWQMRSQIDMGTLILTLILSHLLII